MMEASAQRPTRLVVSILIVVSSLAMGVTMMEGALRLFPGLLSPELRRIVRADPSDYGVAHPYIGSLHRPNNAVVISGRDFHAVHHTDGYGFRNAWPWPATAGIITLGDSVTFGQGVDDEQAWPAILARSFPHAQLVNLGLIGSGPRQYLRIYETFGLELHPKLVLVGLFLRNDFWDEEMFDAWWKSGVGGNYMVWRDFGRPTSTSLRLHQPIGSLIGSLVWRAKLLARKSYLCNLLLYVRVYLKRWIPSATKIFQAPDGIRLELQPKTEEARPGDRVFQLVVDDLQRIHSLARENGASSLIVLQPSKEEVYLPLLGEPAPDPGAPLRAALAERGIPYVDLLDEFRRHAAKGEVLFFEVDGHPNARGYALIAELVRTHLEQHAKELGLSGVEWMRSGAKS